MDVGVEKDCAGHRSRQPSTERGFADSGRAGDDQQGWFDEVALVGAIRAPQRVANRGNQVQAAPASTDLTRERHTRIMSPRRPLVQPSSAQEAVVPACRDAGRRRRSRTSPEGGFDDGTTVADVVRPESWTRPVGASPTRVSAGKPGSRPRFVVERRRAERGFKSLFGGSKCAGRSATRHESCSLVTRTMREPSRSRHGEGSIRWIGAPDMPPTWSLRGMGSGTCTWSGSEQERPVLPALSAKTARISQW